MRAECDCYRTMGAIGDTARCDERRHNVPTLSYAFGSRDTDIPQVVNLFCIITTHDFNPSP
jgi:hypothetical protein